MKLFVGIFAIIIGALLVIKSEWFLQNFGSIQWAEEHMGSSGGSRLMYKLLGIAAILIALMLMTNLLQLILINVLGPLFGLKQ
ncbi:MAG: hypothetical protein AAB288_10675 [Acidobacteriota bacterium]